MKTARRRTMKGAGCGCGVPRLFQNGGGSCGTIEGFNACPMQGGKRRVRRHSKTKKSHKKAHKKH